MRSLFPEAVFQRNNAHRPAHRLLTGEQQQEDNTELTETFTARLYEDKETLGNTSVHRRLQSITTHMLPESTNECY